MEGALCAKIRAFKTSSNELFTSVFTKFVVTQFAEKRSYMTGSEIHFCVDFIEAHRNYRKNPTLIYT